MADERLEIEIVLEDGSIAKGFKKLEDQAKNSGRTIESKVGSAFKNVGKGIFSLKTAVAGLGLAFTAAFAGKRFVEAAQVQQDAVNSLNTSLRLAGRFSQEASQDFQDFASALQQTTTVGDEVTLELAALAGNFARTNEEAKQLTEAAIELSAATGLELEGSLKNLGKTFAGLTGELGESIPELRNLTAEQLKSGEALQFVLDRFGGAAASKLQTFSGAVEASGNAFGDLQEQLGAVVTTSPTAVRLVNDLKDVFVELGKEFSSTFNNRDIIQESLIALATFGQGVNDLLVRPLELGFNVVNVAFQAIRTGLQGLIVAFTQTAGRLVELVAPESDLARGLALFRESSGETFVDFANSTKDAAVAVDDFSASDSLDNLIGKLNTYASVTNKAKQANKELAQTVTEDLSMAAVESASVLDVVGQTISGSFSGIASAITSSAEVTKAQAKDINKALSQNLSQGIGNTIQSTVDALVSGQNAFEAFGKSILGLIGDLLIQIGQGIISIGIAKQAIEFLPGGAAVAAGFGLVALGSLLKSISGSSSFLGGSESTGTADPSGGLIADSSPEFESVETATPDQQAVFNLTIQGDILDRRESGLAIKEILEDFGAEQGGVVFA